MRQWHAKRLTTTQNDFGDLVSNVFVTTSIEMGRPKVCKPWFLNRGSRYPDEAEVEVLRNQRQHLVLPSEVSLEAMSLSL